MFLAAMAYVRRLVPAVKDVPAELDGLFQTVLPFRANISRVVMGRLAAVVGNKARFNQIGDSPSHHPSVTLKRFVGKTVTGERKLALVFPPVVLKHDTTDRARITPVLDSVENDLTDGDLAFNGLLGTEVNIDGSPRGNTSGVP